MIPAKSNYEAHDAKLVTIVEIFKHWGHYLKSNTHNVSVFTDYKNFEKFIEIKYFSGRQVC